MKTMRRDIISALIFSKDNKLFMGKNDPEHRPIVMAGSHLPPLKTLDGSPRQ
jgi:hypothetical protein